MKGSEPRGVKVVAALEVAGGMFTSGLSIYYLSIVYSYTSSLGRSPLQFPDFYSYFVGLAALGFAALPVAYGLWKGRGWGWTLGTYLGVAYMAFCIGLGSYFISTYGDYTEIRAGLAYMGPSIGAVFYLDRPNVKEFFGVGTDSVTN